MPNRILKYPLTKAFSQTISTHRGAKVLYFGHQYGCRTVWMEVNQANPKVGREILIVWTGEPAPDNSWAHIGTLMEDGGQYVVHGYIKNEV